MAAEFVIPRSSSNDKASRNSESAYEVANTAVTLDEKGLALLKAEPVGVCGIAGLVWVLPDVGRRGSWPRESGESVVILALFVRY